MRAAVCSSAQALHAAHALSPGCWLPHLHLQTHPTELPAAAPALLLPVPQLLSGSSRRATAMVAAAAATDVAASTQHPLIDWVQRSGGAVHGVGVANLAGSDGGSGWGLVAAQVGRTGTVYGLGYDSPSKQSAAYAVQRLQQPAQLVLPPAVAAVVSQCKLGAQPVWAYRVLAVVAMLPKTLACACMAQQTQCCPW